MIKTPETHIRNMLATMPEPNRSACLSLMDENIERLRKAPGSSHNHQAWEGGYLGHVSEVMNIAKSIYGMLHMVRPHPFTLQDAYLVLFLHDIEKPWKYVLGENELDDPDLATKEKRNLFRHQIIAKYCIQLTAEHENGIEFAEGEIHKYSNRKRNMGPLAAFCHMCDVWSARGWHDQPNAAVDDWSP